MLLSWSWSWSWSGGICLTVRGASNTNTVMFFYGSLQWLPHVWAVYAALCMYGLCVKSIIHSCSMQRCVCVYVFIRFSIMYVKTFVGCLYFAHWPALSLWRTCLCHCCVSPVRPSMNSIIGNKIEKTGICMYGLHSMWVNECVRVHCACVCVFAKPHTTVNVNALKRFTHFYWGGQERRRVLLQHLSLSSSMSLFLSAFIARWFRVYYM